MQGDCKNFSIPMQAEFSAWKQDAHTMPSGKTITDNLPKLALNTKTSVLLNPQSTVQFIATPQKSFSATSNPFAGIIAFNVPTNGIYRISAGDRIWFDVVDAQSKQIVATDKFEMQTHCDKIFKVVVFDLKADTNYILQISSSAKSQTNFLLTKQS